LDASSTHAGINTFMYYYVYQITNLVNGKIYVGKHKSHKHPLENEYFGSGKLITTAIKKYGKENFKKEVLYLCSSMEEINCREAEVVTENFVKRKDTYNMRKGGDGGWGHWNGTPKHRESAQNGGNIAGKKLNNFIAEQKAKNTEWWQNYYRIITEKNRKIQTKANSPEAIAKKKETFKKIKHSQGENNSQFGRIWISNILSKEVVRISINDAIPEGWVRGKKGHVPKKLWVNNGIKEHYILTSKETEYMVKGFARGRLKRIPPTRIVV
jgi:Putative endonuclease segE, GIY-YIG domain